MTDAIYIHIPFCMNKCEYCDFLSFKSNGCQREEYVNNLIEEIRLYPKYKYNTVYFGGGTPSLLEVKQIKMILDELSIDEDAEVTLEVNPQTVDEDKLRGFMEAGINRLSIGVQSFNEKHLKTLGRLHSKERAIETYNRARAVGFKNISLDLMFSLPNQTMEELNEDLDIIIDLNPEHISIYSLIWEEGTPFFKKLELGELDETDNDLEADMYERIINKLEENEFLQYEISNFSKDGKEAIHNSKYWRNVSYLAVGLGASGYIGRERYKNKIDMNEYYEAIKNGEKPAVIEETLEDKDIEEYKVILGLRLIREGVEVAPQYVEKCDKLLEEGYLKKIEKKYLLTRKGIFFANNVFQEFL